MTAPGAAISAITTEAGSRRFGHYAQATGAGGVVYVSGQLAASADGSSLADRPFEQQARQALANLVAIDAEALGSQRPARAVVPVPALHHGHLVELDAVAFR